MMRTVEINELTPVASRDPDGILVCGGKTRQGHGAPAARGPHEPGGVEQPIAVRGQEAAGAQPGAPGWSGAC
eukprot:10425971-Alexandrium_andersonii.AAC.1